MKSELSVVKLKDVCTIKYGKDCRTFEKGNTPVYGTGGIIKYIDRSIHDQKSVLIPRKGTLQNLFLVQPPFWTIDTLFWTDIDEDKIMPEFLYYQLKTMKLQNKNVGTAVPSLTTALLNELNIKLPTKDIQKTLTSILINIDDKIALNNKINDNLAV